MLLLDPVTDSFVLLTASYDLECFSYKSIVLAH